MLLLLASSGLARADTSKLAKEAITVSDRGSAQAKQKLCCGYPLTEELGFRLTYYWMASQDWWPYDHDEVDLYTKEGYFLGSFPGRYVKALRTEGSGWLSDGRVVNYSGRCRYGVGTCFETLDGETHPYGRGAKRWPLVPFKSIAVDRRLVALGETLYIPEFDGLVMPDGSIHDGCVRADDTGGAIKKRLVDFFVVERPNFKWMDDVLWRLRRFTPHIEDPRCDYLRRR